MHQIYEEKKHISYEKRAKNDKILELMKERLEQGESFKRQTQEEQAMQNYVSKKEQADKIDEEKRLRLKKQREIETKKILDLQLQEKE